MPELGQRSTIILSRTHPDFLRRLFETEILEIAEQTVRIQALAREAGYRSKVAVSSSKADVDAVGACVGDEGTHIKRIVDEVTGERIDIFRWSEIPQELIAHALQPAEIDKVTLFSLLGRAIVLVRQDQLSLAIGRRGQNVRLAAQLVGWDLEIMTSGELAEVTTKAIASFSRLDGVDLALARKLLEQGILSFRDLSAVPISGLVERINGLSEELAARIVAQAETLAGES
jgi:N utilization substance protein A